MHFVPRGTPPPILQENQSVWTQEWLDYYQLPSGKIKKATRPQSHWLKSEIRLPLIQEFKDNCAFCGIAINSNEEELRVKILEVKTSEFIDSEEQKKYKTEGEVDHFVPKAKNPRLAYEWRNLLWSCHDCNDLKHEFYDPKEGLFHPCEEKDTSCLKFDSETGKYRLKKEESPNPILKKCFKSMETKTTINNRSKRNLRKERFEIFNERLNFLAEVFEESPKLTTLDLAGKIASQLPSVNSNKKFQTFLSRKQQFVPRSLHDQLVNCLNNPNFRFLIGFSVQSFLEDHPDLAKTNYLQSTPSGWTVNEEQVS